MKPDPANTAALVALLLLTSACADGTPPGPEEVALAATVEQRLETKLGARGVEAEAKGAVVTLRGRVDNGLQKTQAEKVAHAVEGVERVENEILIAMGPRVLREPATDPYRDEGLPAPDTSPPTGMIP